MNNLSVTQLKNLKKNLIQVEKAIDIECRNREKLINLKSNDDMQFKKVDRLQNPYLYYSFKCFTVGIEITFNSRTNKYYVNSYNYLPTFHEMYKKYKDSLTVLGLKATSKPLENLESAIKEFKKYLLDYSQNQTNQELL